MNASVAIQVLPTVTDENEVIRIVDEVIDYIKSTGLNYYVGPCETSIEGDYDELMEIVKNCQLVAAKAGCPAMNTYVKISFKPEGDVLTIDKKLQSITSKFPAIAALALIVLAWYLLCVSGLVPAYMLPSPVNVAKALISDMPLILMHARYTLQEAFYGLCIGILLAFISATLMDRFLTINRAFYPLMVITQTIPTIAIAPVLVLWMGFGMAPKVALVVITTFFPIAIGLLDGYKSVDPDAVNLMRAMGATKFQIFRHLKFPSALNQFFSGLKISASYAVVGAVVAEWLGGFNGLGVYMTRVKKAYSFDKMFAVIIFIVIISLLLMLAVNIIRNLSMPWIRTEKEGNET